MERYDALAERFLRDLVAIPSVNGGELAAAEYIAGVLAPYGFRTEIQRIAEDRANVCAVYGASENQLIFTGHLDVVPTGENWKSGDPFAVKKLRSRYYGRGCCDMKGGIACMMASAIQAVELGLIKDCELRLVFVADEEVDGLGSQHYVTRAKPTEKTVVIIGEPTMLEACIAHRGVSRYLVRLLGKQCHSGTPGEGINAIYAAARFLLEIEKLDKSWQGRGGGILPPPNITATIAKCGVKENMVPGEAEVILDCRTVPGESPEPQIKRILKELFQNTQIRYEISNFITVDPSATSPHGRAATLVCRSYQAAFAEPEVVTYFKGCCDMSYFCKAGFTQTLLCGPGSMDQAHIVDEYIEEDQLHKAIALYTEMIRQVQKL